MKMDENKISVDGNELGNTEVNLDERIARNGRTRYKFLIIINTGQQRILTEKRVNGALHKLYPRRTCAHRIKQSHKERPPPHPGSRTPRL